MRNRRETYVDRFEEQTKQEIQKYNDSLLASNMALEVIRKDIIISKDEYTAMAAKSESLINTLKTDSVDRVADLKAISQKLDSQINDFKKFMETTRFEFKRQAAEMEQLTTEPKQLRESIRYLISRLSGVESDKNKELNILYELVLKSGETARSDLKSMKEEILSIPSEAKEVKEELLKLIEIAKVDKDGVLREFLILKKRSFVQEKLNEYFHLQLDRLKDRK